MHPSLSSTWVVAKWEFKRYFKLKDQIIGSAMLLIGGLVGYGAVKLSRSVKPIEIAVVGASRDFSFPEAAKIVRAEGDYPIEHWQQQLQARKIGGILEIKSDSVNGWSAALTVHNEPAWLPELKSVLQSEKMRWKIQAEKLNEKTLQEILAPANLNLVLIENRDTSKTDRVLAYSLLGAMLLTSWIGLAYMMTGITGEKQQRVTEQIVSAIQPQRWIDGKLLGITAASIGSLAFLFLSGFIALIVIWISGIPLPMPDALQRWGLIPILIGFYLAGVMFWNYFYAGISSAINDPNSSSKTSLLFLPMLPMIAAGLLITHPDCSAMRIMSLVPGTSAVAMPIRLVLGEVTWLELVLSIVLMIAGVALLRTLAGRLFSAAISLYGKEPTWLEISKWVIKAE